MKATDDRPVAGLGDHWDTVYDRLTPEGVSWYEPGAPVSLDLVEELALPPDTPVLDVGGGASALVDGLVAGGYSDISVLDISAPALEAARKRLPPGAAVDWLHEDLLAWQPRRRYGLWHDRAVFHFLTDPADRMRYLGLMYRALHDGGHVIMATFAPDGPDSCSGLPVARYSAGDLTAALGSGFIVTRSGRHDHRTPSGKFQPFTWIVARKTGVE